MAKWRDEYGREWMNGRPTGFVFDPARVKGDPDGYFYEHDEATGTWILHEEYIEMVSLSDQQRKMRKIQELKQLDSFDAPPRPKQRVRCPDHGTWMNYRPSDDLMVCGHDNCPNVAERKQPRFSELFEVDGDVHRVVYRGELEILKAEDGTRYLHLVGVNGLVDISQLMQGAPEDVEDDTEKVSTSMMAEEPDSTRIGFHRRADALRHFSDLEEVVRRDLEAARSIFGGRRKWTPKLKGV